MSTLLAVQNGDLLRTLKRPAGEPAFDTIAAVARAVGRDSSNVGKSLAALEGAGLVKALGLTPEGLAFLPKLDVLDGRTEPAGGAGLRTVRHDQVEVIPGHNPRTDFESEEAIDALDALRESIVMRGLKQPILLRPTDEPETFELIAGERRWRAIGMAIDEGDFPEDYAIKAVVEDLDDEAAALDALIENLLRRDLHPLEEAGAYHAMTERGQDEQAIAHAVSRTKKHVQDYLKLHRDLPEEDKERMRLPRWDPQRLTLRQARYSLQEHKGATAAAANPVPEAEARQADVEEDGPRAVTLSPMQALILLELKAACERRPAKKHKGEGQATELRTYVRASENPDVAKLFAEGLALFPGGYPSLGVLTPTGEAWLGKQPGTFMELEWRLDKAREEAGAKPVDEGRSAIAWLDYPPPPPAAEIDDVDALVVLELFDSWHEAKTPYHGAQVRFDYDRDVVGRLVERGWAAAPQKNYEKIWRIRLTDKAEGALKGRWPDITKSKVREEVLRGLRDTLHAPVAEGGFWSTEWLNAPFALDPQAQAENAERDRQIAERQAEVHAERAEVLAFHAEVDAFEAEAALMQPAARGDRLRELMEEAGAPAPWRPASRFDHAGLYAANDEPVSLSDGRVRRLLMIGHNMAAGIDPAEWISSRSSDVPLTREQFIKAMQAALKQAPGETRYEYELRGPATEMLDRVLSDEGIVFGDDDWGWTEGDAAELVQGELEAAAEDASDSDTGNRDETP